MKEIFSLKKFRNDLGLTQKECARAVGVTERNYRRYEDGECSPPLGRIIPLARIFKVPISDIVYACSEMMALGAKEITSDGT